MDRVRARDPSARRPHGDARRFFHKLVDVVVSMLGSAFPELKKDPENVKAVLKEEEELFLQTLERGLREFKNITKKMKGKIVSGADAFLLYST